MTDDKVFGAMEAAAIREESDIMVKFEKKPKAWGKKSASLSSDFVSEVLQKIRKLESQTYEDLESKGWLGVILYKESTTRSATADAEALVTKLYNIKLARASNDKGSMYYEAEGSVLADETILWTVDVNDCLWVCGFQIKQTKCDLCMFNIDKV